ncbi:MAG: CoA transferase, partial [Alphaproteobacteria bacterium]
MSPAEGPERDDGTAPPLAGLRVVDLCDLRGALAGRLLADLGADVVLVEPTGGSTDRMRAPFVGGEAGPDRSIPFLYRHAGKRGVALDPGDEAGRRALDDLLGDADVLVENLALAARSAAGL